ncbi:DUF6351 family protein [Comamonas composti]|uniref:DUF6351 family protein n=1 Tax=Comamonas composti TaxID=408558 RepID=UPI00040218DB|nr:DUF6351 family protein [Comamonas composti]
MPKRFFQTPWAALGLLAAAVLAGCGGSDGSGQPAPPKPAALTLQVLSSRADMVSGGSAVVRVGLPEGIQASEVRVFAGQAEVTSALAADAQGRHLQGLVEGLALGESRLLARVGEADKPKALGELALVSHAADAPVFSGPRLTPFECRTVNAELGAPLDANCSVATRHDWFYLTTAAQPQFLPLADPLGPRPADLASTTTLEGRNVPFIVRVESGTINRSIYRIAVLDDPQKAGQWNGAWNGRVVFRFGESTAAQYNQGSNTFKDVFKTSDLTDPQNVVALGSGFAYVMSSLNINKVNVNDVLAAETAMRLREHIAKTYGVPRWMLGMGGSGGAIQQMLIAQNYPGILDGLMPDAAFPDVFGTALAVSDCRLLNRFFRDPANAALNQSGIRQAFEGHLNTPLGNTCANWDAGNGDAVLATHGSINPACGLMDQSKVYHPVTNPRGARCTVYDINVNTLGQDPLTGAARRPLDNVGVQYGLQALRRGQISMGQFLDVNAGVGGFDADGNLTARRTVADAEALRLSYEMGRMGSGAGGLATVPIMHMRAYAEPAGDIHTIYNDIKIREQLMRSNGRADNQVIWVLPHPDLGAPAVKTTLVLALRNAFTQRLGLMTQWLDGIAGDAAPLSTDKIVRFKPAQAVDSCWLASDGSRVQESASYDGAGICNAAYPKTAAPRMVAGAPVTDDVIKCRLKPVDEADYLPVVPTAQERLRLSSIFPDGVCDYTQPGIGQTRLKGTWLKYPAPQG